MGESEEGLPFLAMPLYPGETLKARLAREGTLPVAEAVAIAEKVAQGLASAHAAGIVHRDVKPGNVMLLPDGAVKVLDFGLAKVQDLSLTGSRTQLGTVIYMAPEQIRGAPVDERTDLWALGVVLYEMLTGRRPFEGENGVAVAHAVVHEEPIRPSTLRGEIPRALEDLLYALLRKDPPSRPRTARQVSAELAEIQRGHPYTARRSVRQRWAAATGWGRPSRRGTRRHPVLAGGLLLLLTALVVVAVLPGRGAIAGEHAVAVLPFENLSADGPHAYFAAGLHDELLTQLSSVAGLSLRGRASVMRYTGTTKSVRKIGEELQVGALVQASVQVVGDRLRFNVQLVDVATDRTLWAERYDRTLDDAFAIQSEVAQQVVAAVGSALNAEAQREVTRPPTASAEAYRFYLQGRAYFLRPTRLRQDYEAAEQLYERALALDSTFALAHAALAEVHALTHRLRYDPSPHRLTRAITAADNAIRLAPNLPQAHLAVRLAYALGRGDFKRGHDALLRAAQGLPGDARIRQYLGFSHRGLGQWDQAIAAFTKATELDPADADLFLALGITQGLARRYADAAESLVQAQRLAPDLHDAAITRGWIHARWTGRLDTLDAVLSRLPDALSIGRHGDIALHRATLSLWRRNPGQLLQVLRTAPGPVLETELSFQPVALYGGWAHRQAGDEPAARAAFDSALVLLDARLADLPDDWRAIAARGLALAGLGRRKAAREEVRRLEESTGNADGYFRPQLSEDRARILAQIGEADAALDEIERLLKGPSTLTAYVLQRDPLWDPIREHPRFRRLVAQYRSP